MSNPPAAPVAGTVAEVRARDTVMRYRRSGAGKPVVLLEAVGSPSALWPELTEQLAAHHRIIVPEISHDHASPTDCLAAFLEGLGVVGATVIASDPYCLATIELVLRDSDRIGRVVLVPDGHAMDPGLDGELATRAGATRVPLLIVRRGLSAGEAVPVVREFVAG